MSVPLVAIGDSMTQGVTSGSIYRTEISYPARIAQCLNNFEFKYPDFMGKGGVPLNFERVLRLLVDNYGPNVDLSEVPRAVLRMRRFLSSVEDYWEKGEGAQSSQTGPLHHNLAVSGFQLGDCDTLTERVCRQLLSPAKSNFLAKVPESPLYRIARRTLNPSFDPQYESLSQIGVATEIARSQGGIENLIFWLGSNNCLGTVVRLLPQGHKLEEIESKIEDVGKWPHQRQSYLWKPEHFQILLDRVAPKIQAIGAENVFIGTVPHVTIPPISRGITPGERGSRALSSDGYYEYYTHFWIGDEDFSKNPHSFPYLTADNARKIDRAIDAYNEAIKQAAQQYNWHVVDICEQLDRLAFRRQVGQVTYEFPPGLIEALNELAPKRISTAGKPLLDTRYIRLVPDAFNPEQRVTGGLIGLDGFHPTPVCYGLIAWEFMQVMERVGVEINIPKNWWRSIVLSDSLLMEPPANLEYLTDTLSLVYRKAILRKLLEHFA
ncbi:hypothetical protein [Oscillatoria sp. FACHB-1406]|uniref:hypothetical protein n=1 Tax=Oscillatoria sp. FACHB-1406 TaxID=2692846 RepID=UPI00168233FD|nr:hypothetical protein [Oscillatoria sp. FACHB-1406]MBD2579782.1 hypothetical protein [Oscillatoria sp. FACHB-1406]